MTYPYCYAATFASESIQSLNASVFNAIWYNLSVKYQHYIGMMLMPSKKHVNFRHVNYDVINCSLETFRKVITSNTHIWGGGVMYDPDEHVWLYNTEMALKTQ